jgi:hypothetical protein
MPFDFRRFTLVGLKAKLAEHGFETLEYKKNGNSISLLTQLWIMLIHRLLYTKNVLLNYFINFIFIFPFTLLGCLLSVIFRQRKEMYFGSMILAQKNHKI